MSRCRRKPEYSKVKSKYKFKLKKNENLPALTAKQIIRALKQLGFQEDRQKGSHLIMYNFQTRRRAVVPVHPGRTIKKTLLKSIIENDARVSIEEFLEHT